jgi:hypothetical protein
MYVAVAAIVAAEALLFRSAAMAAYGGILCAAFHAFVVLYEEPNLHSRFGESYDRYRSRPRYCRAGENVNSYQFPVPVTSHQFPVTRYQSTQLTTENRTTDTDH